MGAGEKPIIRVCAGCGRQIEGQAYKVTDGSEVLILCEECHEECVGFAGGDGFGE